MSQYSERRHLDDHEGNQDLEGESDQKFMEGHTHLGVEASIWDKVGIVIAYVILVICVVKRLMQFWADIKQKDS
jgi:hypothetical protein